jgi:mono/diheme cytochrome c family protein
MANNSTTNRPRSQNDCPKAARIWALLFSAVLSCSQLAPGQRREPALPEGEGKQLVAFACSQCHGLQETLILRDGQKGWEDTVNRMVLYGAQLSPSEAELATRYLVTELGPRTSPAPSGDTPQSTSETGSSVKITLASGPGKDLVAERCSRCHGLEKALGATRTKADWESVTRDMVKRGMPATPDEVQLILAYLRANYSR